MKGKWIDWVFFGVIAAIFLALLLWYARPAPHDGIAWHATLTEAQTAAAASGKPVFIKFTADWCGPCRAMDRSTFPAPRVGAALADYEAVKVDGDEQPQLLQAYGVTAYPTLLVLSPEGELVKRYAGALEPDEFVEFLTGS